MYKRQAQNGITDCFRYGWTAKKTGDAITFLAEGSCIAVQYRKSVKLPAPVALAVVDDDTEHAVRLDANFDETWGDKLELATLLEQMCIRDSVCTVQGTLRCSGRRTDRG